MNRASTAPVVSAVSLEAIADCLDRSGEIRSFFQSVRAHVGGELTWEAITHYYAQVRKVPIDSSASRSSPASSNVLAACRQAIAEVLPRLERAHGGMNLGTAAEWLGVDHRTLASHLCEVDGKGRGEVPPGMVPFRRVGGKRLIFKEDVLGKNEATHRQEGAGRLVHPQSAVTGVREGSWAGSLDLLLPPRVDTE